jgi:hypothetical protein
MVLNQYDPTDWYWGPFEDKYYSSKTGARVNSEDIEFEDWKNKGHIPTPYPQNEQGQQTHQAMIDEMKRYKLDPASRVQARLDNFAKDRGYDDIAILCSYKDSTIASWANEAQQAISIRDQTWEVYFQHEGEDWPVIEAALPTLPW